MCNKHCVKRDQIRSFFWSIFSCIWTEYTKRRTRKNSVFGHYSRNEIFPDLHCATGSIYWSHVTWPFAEHHQVLICLAKNRRKTLMMIIAYATIARIKFWQVSIDRRSCRRHISPEEGLFLTFSQCFLDCSTFVRLSK